jgi:hypothetical protein
MLHDTVITASQDKGIRGCFPGSAVNIKPLIFVNSLIPRKEKAPRRLKIGGGETVQGELWIPKEISYPARKR